MSAHPAAELAVTGAGCLTAAGRDAAATWASLTKGQRAPAPPRRLEVDIDPQPVVFEIASDLEDETARAHAFFSLDAATSPPLTRTMRLAWIALAEACAQAGLSPDDFQDRRIGLAVGTTVGCTLNDEAFYRDFRAGRSPTTGAPRRYLANNPGLQISQALTLRGPAATLNNACSSGADAVDLAALWLRQDLCDVALVLGADELTRVTLLGFSSLLITDPRPCRPFDRRRRGLNLGEGAGALVLEHPGQANRRGAPIRARLLGSAAFSDAHHPTAPHPDGRGLRRAIETALRQARLTPSDIAFVNTHGTATPNNDRVEGRLLADLLRPDAALCATKAYTGHTLGAAGAIEAVLTILALETQTLPPLPFDIEADPECAALPISHDRFPSGEAALSNSLAFGGANTALVFGKA